MSRKVEVVEPITVTVDNACRMSGLGRTLIFDLMRKKQLKSLKIRGRRLILVDSLRALIAEAA
jgi:hypothetical protein